MITSRTCRHCEISKKLTLNPTFSFPLYMGRSLQIFAWGMSPHAHVFSFTNNAVVLSHFRCVHPENQTRIFRFYHFYESKQTLLTQDLKWSLEQRSALYSIVYYRRQTDLLLCRPTILLHPPLSSSSKHVRRRSRLLLYSISVVQWRKVYFFYIKTSLVTVLGPISLTLPFCDYR